MKTKKQAMKNDLTVTLQCNNNCGFCPRRELLMVVCRSGREIHETIKKIGSADKSIVLSGGEVTIRKDFFSLIDECKKNSIDKIGIVTNGRMFSYSEFVRKTLKKGVSGIILSIYSTKKGIHEGITNSENSLAQSIQGIKNILKLADNPRILRINIVISKRNIDDVMSTVSELHSLGVSHIILIDVITDDEKYMYSYNRLNHVVNDLIRSQELAGIHITLRGFPLCIFDRNILSESNKTRKIEIDFEPHDANTLFHLNTSVVDYINEFNSKFTKDLKKCTGCEFGDRCIGIQKSRMLLEKCVRE